MYNLQFQTRATAEGKTLSGLAAPFDVWTERVSFGRESFAPGSFGVIEQEGSDVVALGPNHNLEHVLGRQSAGTLRLRQSTEGLVFEIDMPDTQYAKDLGHLVERGDITGVSVGFQPKEVEKSRIPGGLAIRHTQIAGLRDVSLVTIPAYATTNVSVRSGDSHQSMREQMIRARARVWGIA